MTPDPVDHGIRVDVTWLVPDAVLPDRLAAAAALLTPAERERAETFARGDLRRDHLATRVLQRRALSAATGVDPATWRFAEGAGGRPEIAAPEALRSWRFSLSHTAGLIGCAVCRARAVGLDVEHADHARDVEGVARRFFAPEEAAAILAAASPEREILFLRSWTLKEAFLKGLGAGLAAPLDALRVATADDTRVEARWARDADPRRRSWRFASGLPTGRHVMGLAIEAHATEPLGLGTLWLADL